MVDRISQAELKRIQKDGGRVKRREPVAAKAPAPKPEKPAEQKPRAEKPHASMAASMAAFEAAQEAQNILIAKNTEALTKFEQGLERLVKSNNRKPVPYRFKVVRGEDKLLDEVIARPLEE